jgi:Na+/melibiose symporter-like transporter
MNAGKIIAYIVAAILIFFGVLFIWGAFGEGGQAGWIIVGIISAAIGLALIYWASRRARAADVTNVTLNVDLPGNVNMDTLKCQSCGGTLSPKDITMVAGAPVVTCPFCGTTYQLTEEPKW